MKLKHFLPPTLIWLISSGSASAIILSFEPEISIDIPISNEGVYLDFADASGALDPLDPSAYDLSYSYSEDWGDINLFYGGAAVGTSDTFLPVLASTDTNSAILNLPTGTSVSSSSVFPSSYSGSDQHMGLGALQFESGTPGYIGFVLKEGVDDYYGWMKLTLNDDGSTGTIHSWAWETSGGSIEVGAVPETSNFALLCGLSTVGFILLRRPSRARRT